MTRRVLHQAVGNPLQYARLPSRRPELALAYNPYDEVEDSQFASQILWGLFALGIATSLTRLWASATEGFVIFLLLANLIPFSIMAFAVGKALNDQSTRFLRPCAVAVVLVTIYVNLPLTSVVHALAAATGIGLLTWRLATHWTELCTTSPLDKQTAEGLRADWQGYILLISLIPVGLVFLGQFVPFPLILFLALGIASLQVIEVLVSGHHVVPFTAAWESVVSWLTYDCHDHQPPGGFRSPSGTWGARIALTGVVIVVLCVALTNTLSVGTAPTTAPGTPLALKILAVVGFLFGRALPFVFPVLIAFGIPVLLTLPVLSAARRYRAAGIDAHHWPDMVRAMQTSVDPIERKSVFMGQVAQDKSPLLVPRDLYCEHGHFLGDSGAGKTSLGVAPLVEQLGRTGDCSIIVVDLKADSMELFSTLQAAASGANPQIHNDIPIKHFSNQKGLSTFGFNLLRYAFFRNLDLYLRTDILCGALGLTYGADYGEGYYSSANAAVLYHTLKTYPDITTFRELAERIGYISANAKKTELHPEIRKAGVHVQTVMDRLGSFEALNITDDGRYDQSVIDEEIDFTRVFQKPEFHYYHLSSTLGPGSSPEIARLITYSLLAAATQVERRCQVFLVIDEFQRMVARNIEYMLQLARSMGVGIILANQSMQDLRTGTADLIPAIESNCRYRQWFAVSSAEDRQRLIEGSGETIEYVMSYTNSAGPNGATQSISCQERVASRLTVNDVLLASDHPRQSIVRISRGAGYAQYGGMPFVVESNYHITQEEYQRRKSLPWPDKVPGSFVPGTNTPPPGPKPSVGPVVTTEFIGGSTSKSAPTDPLAQFVPQTKSNRRPSRRKPS